MPDMRLTDEALEEFASLLRQDQPGKEIPREELLDAATRVMRVVELIYYPIPKERVKKFRDLRSI